MILRELYLKNFGKFRDKSFRLNEGINLFYGENETGKSTIAAFLRAMLFGMERQRGRAARNDRFSIYEPWGFPAYYAGTLRFSCDDRQFRLRRSFARHDREQSLVCENDGEELSVEQGDLGMLLDGINESLYKNTVEIGPLSCAPDSSLALELKNYTANFYEAGDAEIHLPAAIAELKEKRKLCEQKLKAEAQKTEQQRDQLMSQISYVEQEMAETVKKRENAKKRLDVETGIEGLKANSGRVRNGAGFLMLVPALLSMLTLTGVWRVLIGGIFFLLFLFAVIPVFFSKKYKEDPEVLKLEWEAERLKQQEQELKTVLENYRQEIEELDENNEERRRLAKEKEALTVAIDTIYEIAGDIQREFGDRLNERASKVLSAITGGKYDHLVIDENLNIRVNTEDRLLTPEQVSSGTVQQIYFAFRMAVTELLFPDTDMPILLDDAFIQYDDHRLASTLLWLGSQKRQVLIFTCQSREEVLLKHLNIPYERLM